jgi:cystathionine gamma-synthase
VPQAQAHEHGGGPGLDPATVVVHAGRPAAGPGAPLSPPLVLASTYHAGGEPSYGRTGNPTWTDLETALGALEGGHALAFASGLAAVSAVLDEVPPGGTVVAPASAYLGTRAILAERQAAGRLAQVRLVDVTDTPATLAACRDADLLWVESPTNPLLDVADLAAVAGGARALGLLVAVDNTFATPLGQRPLERGADLVVHSVTKFLSGHADLVLGAVVSADAERAARLLERRSLGGAVPGPFEAWLALRGLRTLAVRLERAQASATELAWRLARHPAVDRVRYPGLPHDPNHARAVGQLDGFGALVAFEVVGGADMAEAVCAATRLIVDATSLGGVETTMERRARWPGDEGVPAGLIRLSVGCEHVDDLWRDLDQALRSAWRRG